MINYFCRVKLADTKETIEVGESSQENIIAFEIRFKRLNPKNQYEQFNKTLGQFYLREQAVKDLGINLEKYNPTVEKDRTVEDVIFELIDKLGIMVQE